MLTLDANIWIAVYDPADSLHDESALFLRSVAKLELSLYGPAFVIIEAGCALAHRTRDRRAGSNAMQRLQLYPFLTLLPLNDRLLLTAGELGVRFTVRGADALYVATAALSDAPLITWDIELVRRAGALTPTDWLAANAS